MLSLTDLELLNASKDALVRLMCQETPDKFGRFCPTIERLRAAVKQSENARIQHEKYGDDH